MVLNWDEAKRAANIRKHGVDFAEAAALDWDRAITIEDRRLAYGETRLRALGLIGERVYVLIYTIRGEAIRIISLRKANRREMRRYAQG